MHHRTVLVALPAIEKPGEVRMQAFVMTHDARFQIIETRDDRQQDNSYEKGYFVGDARQCRVDGAFKPFLFISAHISLSTRMRDLYFIVTFLTSCLIGLFLDIYSGWADKNTSPMGVFVYVLLLLA